MRLRPLVAGIWKMGLVLHEVGVFPRYNYQESTHVSRCQVKSNGDNDGGCERRLKSGKLDRDKIT